MLTWWELIIIESILERTSEEMLKDVVNNMKEVWIKEIMNL